MSPSLKIHCPRCQKLYPRWSICIRCADTCEFDTQYAEEICDMKSHSYTYDNFSKENEDLQPWEQLLEEYR